METKDYIELLVQAPIAVILMYFVYKVLKLYGDHTRETNKIIKKQND